MFSHRKKRTAAADADRTVIMYIKTSCSYNYSPENGDRMTQIALVEILNGQPSGNEFVSFVKPDNEQIVSDCEQHYQDNLDGKSANELIRGLREAPTFSEIQNRVIAFLGDPANTRIVVHNIQHVLKFMRYQLNDEGKEQFAKFRDGMTDLISKAAKLSHLNLYHAGTYPDKIDTNKEVLALTRKYYKLDQILDEMKVPGTRNRTNYSAIQDARFVARADIKINDAMAAHHGANASDERKVKHRA